MQADLIQSAEKNIVIEHVSADTRNISFADSTLFIAIKTPHRNGHDFLKDAYHKGVRCFLISEKSDLPDDANVLFVQNTVHALQMLAKYHRALFNYPVIGITGSNGKTIVKEWLNYLLQPFFNIVRSPASYNSQIGVPFSVLNMSAEHDLAIFEAGISKSGEMNSLFEILRPDIGILTHFGDAHAEGFNSDEEKLTEKLQLFSGAEKIIYNNDLTLLKPSQLKGELFSFGHNDNSTVRIQSITEQDTSVRIKVAVSSKEFSFSIPFTSAAAVENALTCFTACVALDVDLNSICDRFSSLPQPEMRLQLQKALHDCLLINDTYSFDIASLTIALDFLSQQKETFKATVIISDLPVTDKTKYQRVLDLLQQRSIGKCIFIGNKWFEQQNEITGFAEVQFFRSPAEFAQQFSANHFKHEIILLKGAREFRFDELANLFLRQVHQTIMQIDLSAMIHNLKTFRSLLPKETKIMAMVKAFGYGSGGSEPAKLLQYHGVDYLAVAYADEGMQLRKEGISAPIMVLNPDEASFNALVDYNLEPELFSFQILEAFKEFLTGKGIKQFPVHIKLDTGMHRLGFEESDLPNLIQQIRSADELLIRSVFTHLAASEDATFDDFTKQQYDKFKTMTASIRSAVNYSFLEHVSNSAGILRHAYLHSDMVRLGIGLYGVDTSGKAELKTVARLTTTVAQVRLVKAGETVGYNRKGVVTEDSIIATLRIGYADGFRRSLGNGKGRVYIKGAFAPVIGNVCMDMIMVNVTGISGVKPGDEVEVMGDHITVNELAEKCDTIPYEILTGVSPRVKRVYLME